MALTLKGHVKSRHHKGRTVELRGLKFEPLRDVVWSALTDRKAYAINSHYWKSLVFQQTMSYLTFWFVLTRAPVPVNTRMITSYIPFSCSSETVLAMCYNNQQLLY